jgi:hypothetical protein
LKFEHIKISLVFEEYLFELDLATSLILFCPRNMNAVLTWPHLPRRTKDVYYSKTCLRNLTGPEHFSAEARFPFNQGIL